MLRASYLLSQTVNKSMVLSLPLDMSHNWLLQRTRTDTDTELQQTRDRDTIGQGSGSDIINLFYY